MISVGRSDTVDTAFLLVGIALEALGQAGTASNDRMGQGDNSNGDSSTHLERLEYYVMDGDNVYVS